MDTISLERAECTSYQFGLRYFELLTDFPFVSQVKETFLKEVIEGIKTCMIISKVEENNSRYTGLDVERHHDGITMSMDDYNDSLAEIKDIWMVSGTEDLTKLELNQYRMIVRKFNCLAQSTRQD